MALVAERPLRHEMRFLGTYPTHVSHRVHKFKSGQCTCLVGDPYAGAVRIDVGKISGTEAVLNPDCGLKKDQFVYVTVEFEEGPSLALNGLVIDSVSSGVLLQWLHSAPRDADKVDAALESYVDQLHQRTEEEETAPETEGETPPSGETNRADVPPADTKASASDDEPPPKPAEPRRKPIVVTDNVSVNAGARTPRPPAREQAPASRSKPRTGATPRTRSGSRTERTERAPARKSIGTPIRGARKPQEGATRKRRISRRISRDIANAPIKVASTDFGLDDLANEKIVVKDGQLDVGATLRSRSKTVTSAELAERIDTVQVINMTTMKGLIKDAVNETVTLLGDSLGEAEKKRLLEEAEESFKERLEAFKAEKKGLETQTQVLQQQLDKAQALLDDERQKVIRADQFTLSDDGMVELESRLNRLLHCAIQAEHVSDELREDLARVVSELLNDEREKIRQKAEDAQNDKIALLEKKVGRLAGSLEVAETERKRAQNRARALESSGTIPLGNVMQAGLDEEDPDRERKLGLLKEIFNFNMEIREQLKDAGRLPEKRVRPVPVAAPSAAEPGTDTDADPATTPVEPEAAVDDDSEDTKLLVKNSNDMVEVDQLAESGDEVDPDDMIWEPSGETDDKDDKTATIKRLG